MSYGTNAPQGFQPSTTITGASWNQATSEYIFDPATAESFYSGDLVKRVGGTIRLAAPPADTVVGVFWGCRYIDASNKEVEQKYWVSGTAVAPNSVVFMSIIDDPNVLFDVQTVGGGGLATDDCGHNFPFVVVAGDSRTGNSKSYVNLAAADDNAVTTIKVIRLTPVMSNPIQNYGVPYNNALVSLNNHSYKGGTGTIGA